MALLVKQLLELLIGFETIVGCLSLYFELFLDHGDERNKIEGFVVYDQNFGYAVTD